MKNAYIGLSVFWKSKSLNIGETLHIFEVYNLKILKLKIQKLKLSSTEDDLFERDKTYGAGHIHTQEIAKNLSEKLLLCISLLKLTHNELCTFINTSF